MTAQNSRLIRATGALLSTTRSGNWFASKIPPLFGVAYLEILGWRGVSADVGVVLGSALLSICCVAAYGHVVNDIFDVEADHLAGKANRLADLAPPRRALFAAAFLLGGFLPALIVPYSSGALALLALNYLWPTAYSMPVIRLKERGLLGVICDTCGSHITPTLFILALCSTRGVGGAPALFVVVATLWAAALGTKGILHHQIADRNNDLEAGTVTFATTRAPASILRFLARFNLLVELPLSALLTVIVAPRCPILVPAFVIYAGLEAVKYRLGFRFALAADSATIRASVPFANEMFYVLWLPMAGAIQIAVDHHALLWLPLLHAGLFRAPIMQQFDDCRAIVANMRISGSRIVGQKARREMSGSESRRA